MQAKTCILLVVALTMALPKAQADTVCKASAAGSSLVNLIATTLKVPVTSTPGQLCTALGAAVDNADCACDNTNTCRCSGVGLGAKKDVVCSTPTNGAICNLLCQVVDGRLNGACKANVGGSTTCECSSLPGLFAV